VAEDAAPSVEDNIKVMDTDHDGQVTVTEVRAYLQSQHGKGYKQALLDEMEIKAGLKSCGSPFSKSLY
jgi:Ca2+-binding EF-hand superfamily protein